MGLPINPAPDGAFNPMSSNVKVYGAIYATQTGAGGQNPDQSTWQANGFNNAMAFIPLK